MDKRNLVLADDWEHEIRMAVQSVDAFLVCLWGGFDQIGFRQKEVRWALDEPSRRPPHHGFIIPFVLEPCDLPDWAAPFHAGNLSSRTEFHEILLSLQKHFDWKPPSQGRVWSRDDIGFRIKEVVDARTTRVPLYVAIGEGDFVRAWRSRLVRTSARLDRPAISKLVILGLSPSASRRLEKTGELRPGFTQTMVQNVKVLQTDPELATRGIKIEWRRWPGRPQFHGFVCRDIALTSDWQRDNQGYLHAMNAVTETHRADDSDKYSVFQQAFKDASLNE